MRIKFFRFLAILLMGHFFLLIVSNNLPMFFDSSLFWVPLWLVSLLLFHLKQILSKRYIRIYIYIVFFIISFFLYWNDVVLGEKKKIFYEIGAVFTALTIYYYFISVKDYKGLSYVVVATLIFIIISATTSIFGFFMYPMAARELAGMLAREGDIATIVKYQSLGIGGYGFFASLTFIPSLIAMRLKFFRDKKRHRILLYFSLIVIYTGLIYAQYFTNFLISTLSLIVIVVGVKKIGKAFLIIIIFVLLLAIIPKIVFIDLFNSLSYLFSDFNELSYKFSDVSVYLQNPNIKGTEFANRASRFPLLFENFIKSPFWGSSTGNQHLHWMNKLSLYGLLGTLPFFLIIWQHVKLNLSSFNKSQRIYYGITIISYIALGTLKAVHLREILIIIFFVVPAIFVIENSKMKSESNN